MVQSLNILQMPSTELFEYLNSEAEANPVITFDSIDFAEHNRRNARRSYANYASPNSAEFAGDSENFHGDSLHLQLSMLNAPPEVEKLGYYLIGLLDENGYLNLEDVERISESGDVSQDRLRTAIGLLQSLEPAGVGAFSLRDSLLLQLERNGLKGSDAWKITKFHLELLGKNQLPQIARLMGTPLRRIVDALQIIRELNPKPLIQEKASSDIEYITPDILILRAEKSFVVELNQLSPDCVSVEPTYLNLYRETDNEKVRKYLSETIRKAQWIREAVRQRCETLMDCAAELLRKQRAFFEYGPDSLKPYSRREMAEQLGRSESTISRAFKDKYIECDWGMFPADYFFPKGSSDGSELTKNSIETGIQDIIDNEDSLKPLSDTSIAAELERQGINLSRRTVAKYRKEMGIPPSSQRKKFSV